MTYPILSRYERLFRCTLVLLLLVVLLLAWPTHARSPHDTSDMQPVVVRITAPTDADVRQLIDMGLDLLSVREGSDLFALVTPHQYDALRAAGWTVRVDPQQTALLPRPASLQAFDSGYRTVEEIEQFLADRAARYPDLTTLYDFGDSWERQQAADQGYDLWALRLTSPALPAPKPVFFLLATIHAREIATAEIATRFIDYLLTGYGSDPEATWLLDEYEIVVVPMANPDGYKLAEQGYLQRKNTNTSASDPDDNCIFPPTMSNHAGVDLNRNFAYQWGTIDAPTLSPCDPTFPGSGPASEPETQALQAFIQQLYPDRPRPADGAPVPPDTTGVLITLHSFSDLVLWPWGHTSAPAPDVTALARLGQRMAAFNGYRPGQATTLYPTSGITDDWSYGELGIASYTFEIGPYWYPCGGFMPPYWCMDEGVDGAFWPRNLPALLYAARVTRAPYVQPAGPDLMPTHLSIEQTDEWVEIVLTLDNNQPVPAAVELYIGASPWQGSVPIAMQPQDGTYLSDVVRWTAAVPASQFAAACADSGTCLTIQEQPQPGETLPLLLLRGRSTEGDWGPMRPVWARDQPLENPGEEDHKLWLPLVRS